MYENGFGGVVEPKSKGRAVDGHECNAVVSQDENLEIGQGRGRTGT